MALGRTQTRPWGLLIVLALSLALNVFTIGGFAYARWAMGPRPPPMPGERLQMMAHRLHLTPDQQPAFDAFSTALRGAQGTLIRDNHPIVEHAWDELSKPTPNLQVIEQHLDDMAAHRRAFQTETTTALIHFMSALTPEQRAELGELVMDGRDPAGAVVRHNLAD